MNKKHIITFITLMLLTGCSAQQNQQEEAIEDNSSEQTENIEKEEETKQEVELTEYSNSEDGEHVITESGEYSYVLVTKTGDSDSEEADFYGENSAVFAKDGTEITITDSEINTDGKHANVVFSYDEGSVINISDSVINTTSNNSGGLMVTGGGTINAEDLNVVTQGNSSAAIRSDRGGGTQNVTGGYYETNGKGSPVIYCTADVYVTDAKLVSNVSQGIVIEGKNSVTLTNVELIANNTQKNSDKSDKYQAVKIYQSMSGDAAVGTATFSAEGGSITSLNGGMFWVSNTSAVINLNNVAFTYADEDFLTAEAAGWGKSGSNGGNVTLNATSQIMEGNITIDSISSLVFNLNGNSEYTGAINQNDEGGNVSVTIAQSSIWTLTADSYIDSLDNYGTINLNGHSLYINGVLYEG